MDILRMFCTILVISVHANLFESETLLGLIVIRIQIIAVPFFAITAGYFLSQNYERQGISYNLRYMIRLLLVYLAASALMYTYTTMLYAQLRVDGYLYLNWYYLFIANADLGHLWFLISLAVFPLIFPSGKPLENSCI